MVWHYHDDLIPGPDATVSLDLTGLPKDVTKVKITHFRIDETHSNSYTAWQKMGSPEKADTRAIRRTGKSRPARNNGRARHHPLDNRHAKLQIQTPAVTLVVLESVSRSFRSTIV